MRNTSAIYEAMNNFRKAQIASRETYLQKKKNLERYKGSAGYDADLAKIRKERDDSNAAARAEAAPKVDAALKAMVEANEKRGAKAPTDEHIRLLNTVKMVPKPSKEMLDSVANSLGGNAMALAALDAIAKEAWKNDADPLKRYTGNYRAMATNEMAKETAAEAIKNLSSACRRIFEGSGASRAREAAARLHGQQYGGTVDPDDFRQEPEYSSEQDFYSRELVWTNYDLFAAAVND